MTYILGQYTHAEGIQDALLSPWRRNNIPIGSEHVNELLLLLLPSVGRLRPPVFSDSLGRKVKLEHSLVVVGGVVAGVTFGGTARGETYAPHWPRDR